MVLSLGNSISKDIKDRWNTRVVPNGWHNIGAYGAQAYITKYGKGIKQPKLVQLALQAEAEKLYAFADEAWRYALAMDVSWVVLEFGLGNSLN